MNACDLTDFSHIFFTFCQNNKHDERRHLRDEKIWYVKEYSVRGGGS
jgi:hypothetical protein